MDFGWTVSQDELYQGIKRLARGLDAGQGAAEEEAQRRLWRECGNAGVLGLSVPSQFGGLGLDACTSARAMEGLGEGCPDMGLVFAVGAHLNACAMPLVESGNDGLRDRMLPRLCDGSWIGANAISESGAGSDLSAIATRALREGDEYVLDGEKSWVTNAPLADVFAVYAVTDPADGYLGISAFMVERNRPGVSVGRPFAKMGLHSAQTAPVRFEGCRVPVGHRLGAEGEGLAIFNRSMVWERTCLFGAYLGAMQRQLEQSIEYALNRRQFRKAIARNQAVSHRIVDMKVRLQAARLLLYSACWQIDQGMNATQASSMAKLAISEAAVQSGLDAIRIHGGLGVTSESGLPQGLLDAVPCTVFSGTSDLQRNVIARELGL